MALKPVEWCGDSRKRIREFPAQVRHGVGVALMQAQFGGKAENAKPLHGFGGAGVLEVIENHQGDTYRAIYTVRLRHAVYVLHCFQKKSPKGGKVPLVDAKLIQQRLREAEAKDREEHA
jgi:phage-related protein